MSERPFEVRRDGFALGLFALSTFFAVLMVQALRAVQPIGEVTGSAAFAISPIGSDRFSHLSCWRRT